VGWSIGGAPPVAGDWVGALNAPSTSIQATYRLAQPLKPGAASNSTPGGAPAARVSVANAAGSGPLAGVAAGSLASIFGANLASDTAAAPVSPLAHTLAGVTAHIGDRILPLQFVSPTQINLQIPPDLAPGDRTVTLSSPGMADVSADFTVVRNAPGLFPAVVDGQIYALVLHPDGTQVTAGAPAQPGELLTAYGTGFGPTDRPRSEGAAEPPAPLNRILDPVTITIGSAVYIPESAFAAPGQVGLDMVQFRLDGGGPSGPAIPISVIANGVSSNTLALPIR